MPLNHRFQIVTLSSFGILLLLGCSSNKPQSIASPTAPTTTPPPPSSPGIPSVPTGGTQIYAVVPGYGVDTDWSPDGVFIFSASAIGVINDEVSHLEIAGSHVAVDGAGNIYVLTTQGIQVSPPSEPGLPYTTPSFWSIDPSSVQDMAVSPTGEIFVSDGKGVAVFAAEANRSASLARYILGQTQATGGATTAIVPSHIAVDANDNLYVQNTVDSSIAVFGPTATGTVSPSRIIAGPLARLASSADDVRALTTDVAGNLYVLCNCTRPDSEAADFGVFEFGPTASGNVAPIQFVTSSQMTSFGTDGSIAVDSKGTLYVDTRWPSGGQAIFQFSAGASGSVAPSLTSFIQEPATDNTPLGIAVQ
jgi:hypothetical protein